MITELRKIIVAAAVCTLAVTSTTTAKAQILSGPIGVSKSDAVWIGVAVAAIGAGIGIGIYYAVRHGHSLNGCAVSGSDGLQLQNRGDGQTYILSGELATIKP